MENFIFCAVYGNILEETYDTYYVTLRGGSRAAATSKMERFVIRVNGCKPLTIITKRPILDVAATLDPPLTLCRYGDFNIMWLSWKQFSECFFLVYE